jgi:5-methylcytosine-specific restriction endonuclease McrA
MLHQDLLERAAAARPHGGDAAPLLSDRHLANCPALVLNADYTPLSYYPLSLWPWQTAIKAVFLERVDIVATYDRQVHSVSLDMKIPSVIALRQFVKPSEFPAFTTWENVAAACAPCNMRKGGRTPAQAQMRLMEQPIRPTSWQLQDKGRAFPPGHLHESWRDWLYWDVELDR